MKLKEIMIRDVVQACPDESIADAAKRMHEKSVGCLVITLTGTVKGIVTDRDLLHCLADAHDPYRCTLSMHMRRPVFVIRSEEDHVTAAKVLRRRKIKRLPVAENGRLVGIVSLSDLAALADEEAGKIRGSLDFFTEVVRAQAAQHSTVPPPIGNSKGPHLVDADADASGLIDVGGPG